MYALHAKFSQLLEERGHKMTGGAELAHSRDRQDPAPRRRRHDAVTDGPYAEAAEQLTGFYLVETDDPEGLLEVCKVLAQGERRDRGAPLRRRRLTPDDARVEAAVRDDWGRLLALLVAQYRRLDLAEDGLGGRRRGRDPHLARPARRRTRQPGRVAADRRPARVVDRLRRESVAARALPLLAVDAESARARAAPWPTPGRPAVLADERLRLVLLCAHPSLRPEAAAALTLRMVLGVSTEDLARLFLVRTSTMAARLTRARKSLGPRVVRGAVRRRARLPGRGRRGRRLPGLHGRVRRRVGTRPAPRRRVGRGDPPGAGAARAHGSPTRIDEPTPSRARRTARADAAPALAARRPRRRAAGWCCCPTRTAPAGTRTRSPRRSRSWSRWSTTPRAVPAPGADRRRARDRARPPSAPTGAGS